MNDLPLLGPAEIRELAEMLGIRPTKILGQNFVIDPNTIRRIVNAAEISPEETVLEVGPGLGSLTLGILDAAKDMPYNVAVPVLLHLFAQFPSIRHALVMVQDEVADRLSATPGSKIYGVPSVKANWYAEVYKAGVIGKNVFWPAPKINSGLVGFRMREEPLSTVDRDLVFTIVDAAFAQRRKTLRAALSSWAGSGAHAEQILVAAGIAPTERGEKLDIHGFIRIAEASLTIPAESVAE